MAEYLDDQTALLTRCGDGVILAAVVLDGELAVP